MIKSDSDSKLSEKSESSNASAWGSFSGSFFEAGTVGQEGGGASEPVSSQPVQTRLEEGVVTSAPSKVPIAPLELPGECVAPSSSSVLGGEEGLTSSWEEEKFSTSRLVVTDGENSNSSNSPSVELVSPTDQPGLSNNSNTFQDELESVDQSSSCVSQSSIDVISPSSVELISPSDVEVISPEPFDEKEEEVLAPVVNVEDSLDLDSSMSSDRTVVDCQENQQEQPAGGMQDLLEEAMVDSEKKSETSSSRSSEIVKVESLPVSEVTSCDELEVGVDIDNCTTDSSDIEVISSPGCGGGKGSSASESSNKWGPHHVRNTSGQSAQGEGNDTAEVELLRKRNKELTDLLGARESRLVAVSREIAHLQEESGEMAMRLQGAIEQTKLEKVKAEEKKKEVKGLENKVSIGQGEINRLEKEVAKLNRALKEVGGEDQEKDEIINDLRSEGEALARQNGKQAEVIRKLRAKEKGIDSEVYKLKSDLEKNVIEVERLRKRLAVKNELEDNLEKVVGLRSSLESAYREMAEIKRKLEEAAGEAAAAALSKEVSMREEAVSRLEDERRAWHLHKGRLEGQVVNLQDTLQMQEQASAGREEMYRQEISSLRIRLEQSDNRHEDLAESVGQATKPLLRQIETLQASLREVTSVQERVEQNMAERLQVATHSLAQAQDRERSLQEQWRGASGKIVGLEGQLSREGEARSIAEAKVDEAQEQIKLIEDNLRKRRSSMTKRR